MAEQDVINLVRENINAFSAGDFQRFGATLAEDAVYEEHATRRRVQGREENVALAQGWKKAFPDAKGSITSIFASGDKVIAEITWEGIQTGDLVGPQGAIPATGKSVRLGAAYVSSVEGGKLKETHHYFDMMTMLQQLGVVP